MNNVTVVRYRRADCGRTFRRYPPGIDRRGLNGSRDWGIVPESDLIGGAWLRRRQLARFGSSDDG